MFKKKEIFFFSSSIYGLIEGVYWLEVFLTLAMLPKSHLFFLFIWQKYIFLTMIIFMPPKKGGTMFCNCRSVCRCVDEVLSALYLLTPSLDQTWVALNE